jgi:cytochrome b subunit of formate dehydrogenase
LAAALFICAAGIQAQEESCLECHEVTVASPLHGEFACSDCHASIDLDIHPDEPVQLSSRELCTSCHDLDAGLVQGSHQEVECTKCHGAGHEIIEIADLASPMSPVGQLQTCGNCHQDPPELLTNYLGSEHSRALLVAGLIMAPSCSDCHGAHDIFAKDDPRSKISSAALPKTCGSCHQLILDTWTEMSAHGQAWLESNDEAPTCVSCHTSHAIREPTSDEQRLAFPESCGNCHEEGYFTFRDSFHGQATDLGFVTAAICSDCHTPHANLPAEDPRSSIHVDNLATTCGACHGETPAGFLSFDPHSDPADPERNLAVHAVWLFMRGLILAVFGFFLVHDILWLQRSMVGMARGEHRPASDEDQRWVQRFDRKSRRLHMIVITTFLLLALTGLPLRFHSTAWAKGLADILGGVPGSMFIHRAAALATFGYFLFHLIDVLHRILVKKERGLLMGWSSMMPRWKDFTDLLAHIRYFLYLGKRPAFDRWTYWEKFDYFAVFWGVMIIGCSGIMLWIPKLVTVVLPGWVLNVAYVIHSEEAFLAIAFIFIFHFFHTHLRPESFPMDTVIFLGSQPLARLREERPVEYRRLVDSGKLEEMLVEPPSRRQVRRAHAIGSIALAVGLLLAVAIVWTLMFG